MRYVLLSLFLCGVAGGITAMPHMRVVSWGEIPADKKISLKYEDNTYEAVCAFYPKQGGAPQEVKVFLHRDGQLRQFGVDSDEASLGEIFEVHMSPGDKAHLVTWQHPFPTAWFEFEEYVLRLLGKSGNAHRKLFSGSDNQLGVRGKGYVAQTPLFQDLQGAKKRHLRTPHIVAGTTAAAALTALVTWLAMRAYKKCQARKRIRSGA